MSKSFLLINSDLAKNRGDRAIAEGIIKVIRNHSLGAKITGISQYPERDKQWYGIDFIAMDFQSLNPIQLIKLCFAARKHDVVLWGGGEILKDYTNKAALWYWVIKMTLVALANPNLYGVYQGIGPTKSTTSKRLIAYIAGRTKAFIVRDAESKDKLLSWGVELDKVISASDPAVLPKPESPSSELIDRIKNDYGIDDTFFANFICIGPRDWFHYRQSGILPYKYRKKITRLFGAGIQKEDPRHETYVTNLGSLVNTLTEEFGVNVLFVPMHMEESDTELSKALANNVHADVSACVLEKDTLSPSELRSLISLAKAMVGFRLHSNIIGISSGVPSLNIYYVDKGRVFFDQIEQSRFAIPIEAALNETFVTDTVNLFRQLLDDQETIRADIETATHGLRKQVNQAFEETVNA